jgi:cobalt-zinc-cadmium resistance protein CzcA
MKAELKPSFNVGYAAQNFNQGGWLNAAQAGVAIPLFNGQTKKRIAAQEKQIEIGNYQYQSTLLSFKQDQLEIQNTLNLYQAGVDFYKNQIETINPEIIRISELNYQAGEISYLELLNTLQLMTTNNKNYWEQILAYNKAVADFQFLTNQ